jgi:hypothetical protein
VYRRGVAEKLEPDIKDALAQRDRARRHKDWSSEKLGDDELDRLMSLLQGYSKSVDP